jgi:hypothetical protein
MDTTAIHRIIEQHAALRGDVPALADEQRALTYRDLNQRANVVARCLIANGFRRGTTAVINMPRSFDLAVLCVGVLKAGGAFAWLEGDRSWPQGISVPQRGGAANEMKVLAIDVSRALAQRALSSPNLPILTRGSDIACVIGKIGGRAILVPHAAVTSLPSKPVSQTRWSDEPGALDLLVGLIAGATVVMAPEAAQTAA